MSPTNPELDAALVAAAEALPSHFADSDDLTIEALSAIQATTLSLPGGAIAVESVLKKADNVGSVIMIVTGLVDHTTGEVFSRDDARTFWTKALGEALDALKGSLGDFTAGQVHMTDAFDALDKADECNVVGLFRGQTLAALLLTLPAKATGQGAAAQLAAAIEAAEAEAAGAEAAGAEEGAVAAADATADGDGADAGELVVEEVVEAHVNGAAPQAPQQPQGMPAGMEGEAYLSAVPDAVYVPPPPRPPSGPSADGAPVMSLAPLTGPYTYSIDPRRIDLLSDVMMGVSVELGRTRMPVQQILGLTPGSIVELDRSAGAPVDVLVNGKLIAHGEVVVVDEEFAVRISEIVSPDGARRVSA